MRRIGISVTKGAPRIGVPNCTTPPAAICCGDGDPGRRKMGLCTWYPGTSQLIVAVAKVPAAVEIIGIGAIHDVRDLGDSYEAVVDREHYPFLVKGIRRE